MIQRFVGPDGLTRICIGMCTYTFIASYLNNLPDIFVFILWYYLLFLVTYNNLTKSIRSLILLFSVTIFVASNYVQNLKPADNVDMDGITFLVVLLLKDISRISLSILSRSERIRVIIKTSIVAICIFLTVSVFMAYVFRFVLFWNTWVYYGPFDLRNNFVFCRDNFHGIRRDTSIEISNHDLSCTQENYAVGSHETFVYLELYLVNKDVKALPLFKYSIQRYTGEGARLECKFQEGILEQWDTLYPFVLKYRVDIHNSYRHNVQISKVRSNDTSVYSISLDIYALEQEDFGTYRAGLRIKRHRGEIVLSQSTYQLVDITELYACVFSVLRIDEYYVYKDVPVGGLLRFTDLYLMLVSNSNHLRVEHIVNEVQLNAIPGISSECCLPSIHSAREVWNGIPFNFSVMKLLKDIDLSDNKFEIFEVVADICVCPSLYGIHRIKFYNDLYDPKEKKWRTVEFLHPQVTVVYPKSPILPWTNLSKQESILMENSKTEKDFSLFNGTVFQYLQSAKNYEFFVTNVLENIILSVHFFMLPAVIGASIGCFLSLIEALNWVIVKICTSFQRAQGHLGYQNLNIENQVETCDVNNAERNHYTYDAFVLYAEEDRHFVMHILQPVFMQNHVRAFIGEKDLPSGPRIENLQVALNQSKIVLVVVSEEYFTDNFYNYFFPNVVLPLLHEGRMCCRKMVFLKSKPCRIPETWLTHDKIVVVECTENKWYIR